MHHVKCRHGFRFRDFRLAGLILIFTFQIVSAADIPRLPEQKWKGRDLQAAKLLQDTLNTRLAGLTTDTHELLTQAVSIAPNFAPARWTLGEIKRNGHWTSLQEIQTAAAANMNLAEYARQRDDIDRIAATIWFNDSTNPAEPKAANAPQYLAEPRTAVRFVRKSFELDGRPRWAQLHVQAMGKCEVSINGHPVMNSAANRWSGVESVAGQLHHGKNVIAMTISGLNYKQAPGVRILLEGVEHDQRIFKISTDNSWKVAAAKADGWRMLQFDDHLWEAAVPSQEDRAKDDAEVERTVSNPLESALARWCQTHQLPEQARFHWTHLLHLQGDDAEAMQALGLISHGNKLMTASHREEAIKAERETTLSLGRWVPFLKQVRSDLARGTPKSLKAARKRLDEADLKTIPAFEQVLNESTDRAGTSPFAVEFVQRVLARLKEPASTVALVAIARNNPEQSVRDAAIEALKGRDLLSFVPHLMGELEGLQEVQTSLTDQDKTVVCTARYFRAGIDVDEERTEEFRFETDGDQSGRNIAVTKAEARQEEIEETTADRNRPISERNERIITILARVSATEQGATPAGWWKWWGDYNELLIPQENRVHSTSFSNTEYIRSIPRFKDCFAQGTPVWTQTGVRPIETIKAGDAVLAQDVDTGEIAFKVVLGTSIRHSSPMISTRVGDETIVSTRGHRYWTEGHGWRMAKSLKAGDLVHGVERSLGVDEVLESPDQPAWNLIVDDFNSYFVGRQGILVHDTGAPRPTLAVVPGLQP